MVLLKYLEDKDVFQTFYTAVEAAHPRRERVGRGGGEHDQQAQGGIAWRRTTTTWILRSASWRLGRTFGRSRRRHAAFCCRRSCCRRLRGTRYYQTKHSGCKLTWLHNYSKNELRTNYTNQKYILMTPADQAAVLLQYNGNDTLSLTELQRATTFSPEILGQVLALLVKAKVLINEEKDQYDLNPGFKSKKIRVNPNLPIKADVKAESSGVLKVVDEDRKDVIQVMIVRIVKAGKTMKNQALIRRSSRRSCSASRPRSPTSRRRSRRCWRRSKLSAWMDRRIRLRMLRRGADSRRPPPTSFPAM
ncbi:hypothetical protein B0H14DRAFT_557623 [Mycena olivaceomarginata]|nr:hypothetical protein B0H14DRAFT_557623 [Mycena olivaceomarginata]